MGVGDLIARRRASVVALALVALLPTRALAQGQALAYPLGAVDRFFGQTIALDDSVGRLRVELATPAYLTLLRILPGQRVERLAASEPLPSGVVSVRVPAQRVEVLGGSTVASARRPGTPATDEASVQRCIQREMAFWRQATAPRPGYQIDATRPSMPSLAQIQGMCGGRNPNPGQAAPLRSTTVVRTVSDYLLVVVSEQPLNDSALVGAMQARADLTVEAVGEELGRMAGEQGPAWAAWLIRR